MHSPMLCGIHLNVMQNGRERIIEVVQQALPLLVFARLPEADFVVRRRVEEGTL